jgi:hypothetical protein
VWKRSMIFPALYNHVNLGNVYRGNPVPPSKGSRFARHHRDRTKMHPVSIMRWIMAIFYLIAGFLHLKSPDGFLPIVPIGFPRRARSFWRQARAKSSARSRCCPNASGRRLESSLHFTQSACFSPISNTRLRGFRSVVCRGAGGTMLRASRCSRSWSGGLCSPPRSCVGRLERENKGGWPERILHGR